MKKITCILLLLSLFRPILSHAQMHRDLLQQIYEQPDFPDLLPDNTDWVPFPAYKDRKAWDKLAGGLKDDYIRDAERYLDYNWPSIPASAYLDFERIGKRSGMEKPLKERLNAFHALVWGELMEGKGRFLDQILNGIFAYCEQTSWCLSAHLSLQESGSGIPTPQGQAIDMQSAEIGGDLAWAYYFFKEELDKMHPQITKRMKAEIYNKLLTPFCNRDDYWWMGLKGQRVNNWNPWINYNVMLAILMFEDDRDQKLVATKKVMRSLDAYLNGYPQDGGCEEGPTYWNGGVGKVFDFLELMYRVTDGEVNLFQNQLIRNMGAYIYKVYIDDSYFINFADASLRAGGRPAMIYKYGKMIEDESMAAFGAYLAEKKQTGARFRGNRKIEFPLYEMMLYPELQKAHKAKPLISHFWMQDIQVMGAREYPGKTDGFFLGAQGGHNQEFHNHNDVGNFILYVDGHPCLIDIGGGTYSKQYFGEQRYTHLNTRSAYHNVPLINGYEQNPGLNYAASDLKFDASDEKVRFKLDIAKAYPSEANVEKWIREYYLKRGHGLVIYDEFELNEINGETALHFITPCQVKLQEGATLELIGDNFKARLKYDSSLFEAVIENIEIEDKAISRTWTDGLRRIKLKMIAQSKTGQSLLEIVKLD